MYSYLEEVVYAWFVGIWEGFCWKLCKPLANYLVIVYLLNKQPTWLEVIGTDCWCDGSWLGGQAPPLLTVSFSLWGTMGDPELQVSLLFPLIFVVILHVRWVPCCLEPIPFIASVSHNSSALISNCHFTNETEDWHSDGWLHACGIDRILLCWCLYLINYLSSQMLPSFPLALLFWAGRFPRFLGMLSTCSLQGLLLGCVQL